MGYIGHVAACFCMLSEEFLKCSVYITKMGGLTALSLQFNLTTNQDVFNEFYDLTFFLQAESQQTSNLWSSG
jgi:hypothetical protein